jgi:quercetin dioxygenase-like cupin family protein
MGRHGFAFPETVAIESRVMRRVAAVLLLLCGCGVAQTGAPIPDDQVPQRKVILNNSKVQVSLLSLAPEDATPMHKHDKDMVTVFVDGGTTQSTLPGKAPMTDKMEVGEVRFRRGGFAHSTKNHGGKDLRAVIVEFAEAQGVSKKVGTKSKTCAPDSKACVEEKQLFCTERVCVENVVMAAGSSSIKHSHATDHLIVAVSDFELTDEVEGKGTVIRKHKSGEVEFLPAGITHRLTNNGKQPAQFTVIVWR